MHCLSGASFFCYLLLALSVAGCGYVVQPKVATGMVNLAKGSYQLDTSHTSVLFKVGHLNLSTFVGRFNRSDAQLEFDPDNIALAKLTALVDITSIDVNNESLATQLQSARWFDAARYPQALFTTTSVQVIDANSAYFTGELSLRGITRPQVLHVTFNGGGYSLLSGAYVLGFSASARLQRSQFAMSYMVPAVGDWVDIEIYAEFKRQ